MPADSCLDVTHHAKVNVCQPVVRQPEQVSRMWVCMMEASFQDLRQIPAPLGQGAEHLIVRMQASDVEASIYFLPAVCSTPVYVQAHIQMMQDVRHLNILTLQDISMILDADARMLCCVATYRWKRDAPVVMISVQQ